MISNDSQVSGTVKLMVILLEAKLLNEQELSTLCYSMETSKRKDIELKVIEKLVTLKKNGIDKDILKPIYSLIMEQNWVLVSLCYKLG